jgi:hypothetical protein
MEGFLANSFNPLYHRWANQLLMGMSKFGIIDALSFFE